MLADRGVEVSEIRSTARRTTTREPDDDLNNVGLCFFADPDGNRWTIQQISSREP